MHSRREKRENSARLAIGLVLIAVALNIFCCSWSRVYHSASSTAIVGVNNVIGLHAKHNRAEDTMLGVIVPAALICVGAFFSNKRD
ncbi:MAG: hypothetical protein AB8G99_06350 [Planctomycetaceae bacterium]